MSLNGLDDLVTLVQRAAHRWPDAPAWIFDATGERLNFADVDRRSSLLAAALAERAIGRGDRVATMLRNQPEFPLLWLAVAKLGAVLVPVNVNYRELDGAHVLADSGARLVVVADEFVDLCRAIAPNTAVERVLTVDEIVPNRTEQGTYWAVGEQPANIQYTSGTTGPPKGCVLPHRYWTTLARGMVTEFPAIDASDIMLTAQPFHYIDPQWNVALGLASGASLVVLDRFHPSTFWDKVRAYDVTWFYCLGLMPSLLLRTPESPDDHRHRVRAITASAIPQQEHAALERRWGVGWCEAFGMTETGADIRVSLKDHDETVGTGCIGTPTRDREVMIVDERGEPLPRGHTGELVIRGVGLMHGYHGDPEATARAFRGGWLHTGDLASMDSRGRVYYVGRTKDMVRRSGENISAEEVERAIGMHPDVRLTAVLAVPDELRGEEIQAYVVLAAGRSADDVGPEDLAQFCANKLAYFKVPRYWAYVDDLPRTPSERIAKGQLRAGRGPEVPMYDRIRQAWA